MFVRIAVAAITGAGLALGGVAAANASGERPPECSRVVTIQEPNSHGTEDTLYVKFCGTGSGGEFPVKSGVRSLTVNGARLTPADCKRASVCYVVWPNSPAS